MTVRRGDARTGDRRLPNIYGYCPPDSDDGMYTIQSDQAQTVRKIFSLWNEDRLALTAIAKRLTADPNHKPKGADRFSPQFIRKVITRLEYSGYYIDADMKFMKSELYPPIIDFDAWKEARSLLRRREKGKRTTQNQSRYYLSGILYCSCDRPYYAKLNKNCKSYYVHSLPCRKKPPCTKLIATREIEPIIEHAFLDHVASKEGLYRSLDQLVWKYHTNIPTTKRMPPSFSTYREAFIYLIKAIDLLSNEVSLFSEEDLDKLESTFESVHNDFVIMNKQFEGILHQYIDTALAGWFSSKPFARRDLIQDYFVNIVMNQHEITIPNWASKGHPITYSLSPTDRSRAQIKRLAMIEEVISHSTDPQKLLYDLRMYLLGKLGFIFQENEKVFWQQANAKLKDAIEAARIKHPRQRFFKQQSSDYLGISDTTISMRNMVIAIDPSTRAYFAVDRKVLGSVGPMIRDDWAIAVKTERGTFINSRFIHTLPEWFYGYNYEYFITDFGKIEFTKEDNEIIAWRIGKKGAKTRMGTEEALRSITESKRFRYMDID